MPTLKNITKLSKGKESIHNNNKFLIVNFYGNENYRVSYINKIMISTYIVICINKPMVCVSSSQQSAVYKLLKSKKIITM